MTAIERDTHSALPDPESLADPWASEHIADPEYVRRAPSSVRWTVAWLLGVAPLLAEAAQNPGGAAVTTAAIGASLALAVVILSATRAAAHPASLFVAVAPMATLLAAPGSQTAAVAMTVGISGLAVRSLEPPDARWNPASSGPEMVGIAVGLLFASTISVMHSGPTANVFAVGLVCVASAALLVDRYQPELSSGIQRVMGATAARVSTAIGLVVMFIVLTIVAYIPGMFGAVIEKRRRARQASSYWLQGAEEGTTANPDQTRPFSRAPRLLQVGRLATGLVLVPVGAFLVFQLVRPDAAQHVPDNNSDSTKGDSFVMERGQAALDQIERTPYSSRPAFEGLPWVDAMQSELAGYKFVPDDVTGYRSGPFAGQYTNVGPNGRATIGSSCPGCPERTIWVVGSSTAFGLGQRDEHTIASDLVRLGDADGLALRVRNLAVPGWTIDQEVADLRRRLSQPTSEKPDMVVVLDGFNDTVTNVFDDAFDRPIGSTTLLDPIDSVRFLGGGGDAVHGAAASGAGRAAAARLRTMSASTASALADEGVDMVHFFQPDAFTTQAQAEYLDTYYEPALDLIERLDLSTALATASDAAEPALVNLRHVFDERKDAIFTDMVHVNETGASVIADAMWRVIAEPVGRGT